MDKKEVIDLKRTIFEDNDKDANLLRSTLKENKTFYLNVMSSPGSGKTTTLIKTINLIKDKVKVAVMEADIDSYVDAVKVEEECGVEAIQLHTGGMCHLDADMSRQGLSHLKTSNPDIVFLENIGNLVCPAEFDTGASKNCMILSVPEGIDKPLKYPLMFEVSDIVLINKIDVLPIFDFDLDKCIKYIKEKNPNAKIIPVCSKTGQGLDEFADWLLKEIDIWRTK